MIFVLLENKITTTTTTYSQPVFKNHWHLTALITLSIALIAIFIDYYFHASFLFLLRLKSILNISSNIIDLHSFYCHYISQIVILVET